MKKKYALLIFTALVCVAPMVHAWEKPVWKIDLEAYTHGNYFPAHLWFSGDNLVIESTSYHDYWQEFFKTTAQLKLAQVAGQPADKSPQEEPIPKPAYIFNVIAHAPVEKEAIGESLAVWEKSFPQKEKVWWKDGMDTPAEWHGSKLHSHSTGELYVEQPGQPDIFFCRRCVDKKESLVRWVAPDRLMIARNDSRQDKKAAVMDLHGVEQYRFALEDFPLDAQVVFNPAGTRFAIFWEYQSRWSKIRYVLDDFFGDSAAEDRMTMKVFSTATGEQIFEKTWHSGQEAENIYRGGNKIALSDDGSWLAYLSSNLKIEIFKLPSPKKAR